MLSLGCSCICFASTSQVIGSEEHFFTSQVIGFESRPWNDLYCVRWNIGHYYTYTYVPHQSQSNPALKTDQANFLCIIIISLILRALCFDKNAKKWQIIMLMGDVLKMMVKYVGRYTIDSTLLYRNWHSVCDVMLVWRKGNFKKLDRALILLSLALSSNTSVSLVFVVLYLYI